MRARLFCRASLACVVVALCGAKPLRTPDAVIHTHEAAQRTAEVARTKLAPVYAPLAEHIVTTYDLRQTSGIGIDLGGGSGALAIELARQTERLFWIDADINPHSFPPFYARAAEVGVASRVGAIFADALALPFRHDYADIIVSRGSFHFWKDKRLGFSEIFRVLKPGGVALVGRGFSSNLPPAVARAVREQQGKMVPAYDVAETKAELERIMESLGIRNYRIDTPRPPGGDGVNYGIWLEIRKPASPRP